MNMESKLKEAKKTETIRRSSTTTETRQSKEPPAGAKIYSQSITTTTEQIENGFLVSKNYDISYEGKNGKEYTYYSKKWYTKDDPLQINVKDKSLADAFDDSK